MTAVGNAQAVVDKVSQLCEFLSAIASLSSVIMVASLGH